MMSSDEKAELRRMIQQEIARAMNVLTNGTTKGAGQFTETIENLFPGMPPLADRPLVQPFGLASVAPNGTLSFCGRVGDHPGSRYVLGHRDASKPALSTGEAALYSVGGFLVRVFADRIQVGKGDDYQTTVCGEYLAELLDSLLTTLASHTHASPGAPPTQAAQFTSMKSNYVDNEKILAKDGGGF